MDDTRPSRPPLESVPCVLRCRRCDGLYRARGSWVPVLVACAVCGHVVRLRPL